MEKVKHSVKHILPAITDKVLEKLLSVLVELGVDDVKHLELVEENDLVPVLKKIQARLLVKAWRNSNKETDVHKETSFQEISTPATKTYFNIDSTVSFSYNFNPHKFLVPWESMPEELTKCLRDNLRPKPSLRNKMVRIIADNIYKITKKPGRKALSVVAEKIVEKYPLSFADAVSRKIDGSSHLSLLLQFERRFDNMNRGDIVNVLKRKSKNEGGNVKKVKTSDSYGCVRYQPELPHTETAQSQVEKCQKMKSYFTRNGTLLNGENRKLLKSTYFSIRKDINSGRDLNFLLSEWPLLFTKEGFLDHFNELVGLDLEKKLNAAISKLGINIISYFLSQQKIKASTKNKLLNLILELKSSFSQKEDLYKSQILILLLMIYFEEDMNVLFIIVEVASSIEEAEINIPRTPCLICYGDNMQSSTMFMLAVDGKIVLQDIKTFESGLGILFASFYCLNIEYPASAATTLEFIQRCFLDINPVKGSKAELSHKKGFNPKIVALKKKITDFEWNL